MFVLPYLISRWSKVWCNNHVRCRGIFIGLTILCLSDTTTINFSCNLVEKKSIFKSWPTLSSSRLAGSKNLSPRSSFFTLRLANFNHIKKSKNLFKITKKWTENPQIPVCNNSAVLGFRLFSLFSTCSPCLTYSKICHQFLSLKRSSTNSFTNSILGKLKWPS